MDERNYVVVHHECYNDDKQQRTVVQLEAPHIPQMLDDELTEAAEAHTGSVWRAEDVAKYFRNRLQLRLSEVYGSLCKEMEVQVNRMLAGDQNSKPATVSAAEAVVPWIAQGIAEGVRKHIQKWGIEYVRQHGERIRAEQEKESP